MAPSVHRDSGEKEQQLRTSLNCELQIADVSVLCAMVLIGLVVGAVGVGRCG